MTTKLAFPTELERLAALEAAYDLGYDPSKPSRSQKKRDSEALRNLGAELVALSAGRLAKLDLPIKLRRAVDEARRLSVHGAKKRQILFIGRVMEEDDCDYAELRASLDAIDTTPSAAKAAAAVPRVSPHTETAQALLEDGDKALTEIASRYAPGELQLLRQALRSGKKALASGQDKAKVQTGLEQMLARLPQA